MYRKLLSKSFFKNNPIEELSAQDIAYNFVLFEKSGISEEVDHLVAKEQPERKEVADKVTELILATDTANSVLRFLRKPADIFNRETLLKHALKFQSELMPKVKKMLITSGNESFIENAYRLLIRCDKNYSNELLSDFDNIRDPYVQSLVCIIMGFRAEEKIIPWMYDKFFEFKNLYPDETYEQGPLLALHELNYRFYSKDGAQN